MPTLKPRRSQPVKSPQGVATAKIANAPNAANASNAANPANSVKTHEPRHAPALKAGFKTIAAEVQNMHLAISSQSFNALACVPGVSVPAGWVRSAHDAITHGVYTAVRRGGAAALSAAAVVERLTVDADAPLSDAHRKGRSAINGVFGDALALAGNPLALPMSLHQHGIELTLTRESLAGLKPRLVVFLHGLACDESSWQAQAGDEATSYAGMLERDLDGDSAVSTALLRYNSGMAVDDSAVAFSALMETLAQWAPARFRELTLVGHSMGGLVARRACAVAAASGATWQRRVGSIICLGTPHQGSGWEKLGHLAAAALSVSAVTQPLARLANARSRGIQDLRHGLESNFLSPLSEPPLRLITGSLNDDNSGALGKLAGAVLGDGLVAQYSGSDKPGKVAGARAIARAIDGASDDTSDDASDDTNSNAGSDGLTADVQRVHLPGLGHMALLHHPRVYAALRSWIGAGSAHAAAQARPKHRPR